MGKLVITLIFAAAARAEFREVEVRVSGLDCASCGSSVEKAIKKIKGVDKVEFKDDLAAVRLTEGNLVTLEQIRDALKGLGYTPGEARVRALGRVEPGGKTIRVTGIDKVYRVDRPLPGTGEAIVEGTVAGDLLKLR